MFVNPWLPWLLWGAGAVTIPIVLHLIMRQKPKLLEFPALRFIRKRHDTNQRKLRLRHLLLLLLRAGAIAFLAMALARPRIQLSPRLGRQEEAVAAALIFDASPHMQYRRDGKTRLDAAREIGNWLLGQLPKESQIAVFDSGMTPRSFDADLGLSKQRINALEIVPNPRSLSYVVGEASAVLKKSELAAKEIYVFTDLSRASWRADENAHLQERLKELTGASLYLIDVGVTEPSDFGLGDLSLSRQMVAAGGAVEIHTDISCLGSGGERPVELYLTGGTQDKPGDPKSYGQKISEQIKILQPGELQSVDFRLTALAPGLHQGLVRIVGQDPLAADDIRYFTVVVRPAWPVLVVAPEPVSETAVYLKEAIAPTEFEKRNEARFKCEEIGYEQLAGKKFDDYAAVCLLDPPPLEAGDWQRLTDYAAAGHGVGVFLGRHLQSVESFNSPAAQQLLPGKVREQVPREEGDTYLAPQNFQHPILKPFAAYATRNPWHDFPVYRYWRIDDLASDAGAVIAYNDGRPALLERTIRAGQAAGHVLVMSTPISEMASRRDAWNVLPVAGWPFVILANQMMSYLVGSGEQQLNYFAGTNSVTLPVDDPTPRIYVLGRPNGENERLPPAEKSELSISGVEQVGNYRVMCAGQPAKPDQGFSANLLAQATELTRLSEGQLGEIFGPLKPRVARSREEIVRDVHDSRVGMEIYPWVVLAVALLLAIEYVVSNWFYKGT